MSSSQCPEEHSSLPNYNSRWSIPCPPPIDVSNIEADGGQWIRLEDGRIVEYFICGSNAPNATVLVDCHGGHCTGKFFQSFSDWVAKCGEDQLNLRVISLSQPGFGYSTILPERKIGDWPMTDLLPVLRKESVREFIVTGISFGTCHALAVAAAFAPHHQGNSQGKENLPKCLGMGLKAPYLGSESCKRLELENHLQLGFTCESANTTFIGTLIARAFMSTQTKPSAAFQDPGFALKILMKCLNPGVLENIERLKNEFPDLIDTVMHSMDRSVIHTTQGMLYNYATDVLLDHGFDVEAVSKDLPVVVWWAKDDEDCPPSHGEYLSSGKHFVKCTSETTRVFEGYGHTGAAFIDHPQFMEKLMSAAKKS